MKKLMVGLVLLGTLGMVGSAFAETTNERFAIQKENVWAGTTQFSKGTYCESSVARNCLEYRVGPINGEFIHEDVDGISVVISNDRTWTAAPKWTVCKANGRGCQKTDNSYIIKDLYSMKSVLKETEFYNNDTLKGMVAKVNFVETNGETWEYRYIFSPIYK